MLCCAAEPGCSEAGRGEGRGQSEGQAEGRAGLQQRTDRPAGLLFTLSLVLFTILILVCPFELSSCILPVDFVHPWSAEMLEVHMWLRQEAEKSLYAARQHQQDIEDARSSAEEKVTCLEATLQQIVSKNAEVFPRPMCHPTHHASAVKQPDLLPGAAF